MYLSPVFLDPLIKLCADFFKDEHIHFFNQTVFLQAGRKTDDRNHSRFRIYPAYEGFGTCDLAGFQINLRLQVIGDVSAFQSGTDALLQIKIAKIIIFIGQAVDFKMGISESALRTFTSADIRIVLGSIEINGSLRQRKHTHA